MSAAREAFVDRLTAFAQATRSRAIQPVGLTPSTDTSRMLRNGLMVVSFAALEDFIQLRTSELLTQIGESNTATFDSLPPRLRQATTVDIVLAFGGLVRQWRARGESDLHKRIQELARAIASTGTPSLELSAAGFTQGRNNVGREDVKRWLGIFGVRDGWRHLDRFAARIGLTNPSLESAFDVAHGRRNAAAHDATADIQTTDLESFYRDALAVAIGFDALTSRAARLIASRRDHDVHEGSLEDRHVVVRFVDETAAGWLESCEGRKVQYRHPDLAVLLDRCKTRARQRHQFVVVRTLNKTPMDWGSTDMA